MKIILSKLLFYLCSAFILGIILKFSNTQGILFLFTFGLGMSLIFSYFLFVEFHQKQKIKLGSLVFILFLIIFSSVGGWIRYNSIANPIITQADLSYFNDEPQRKEIIGIVKRIEQRVKNNRLIIQVEKIKINGEEKRVDGKVMAFTPRLIEINYGDRIKLEGRLKNPQPINSFNWPKHLANEGIHSVIFSPWVIIIEKNQGTFIMSKIYSLNSLLQGRINRFLPYPESAILSAMLLGNRGEIPDEISDNFRQIGLGHILAISGLHITIIAGLFFWIILSLGLWRKHAFILTSLFLIFFILMIGAPPSAIRAGIMGFMFLLAQYLGRSYSLPNTIIFAATLILIFNPLSLFYDIGFQFSFSAIIAIALLAPIFQHFTFKKLLIKKERPILSFFLNTFLISISILLFLGPLMAYYFGNFPAISPIVNLLAIPILPLILLLGIIFLFISLIFPPLAIIFSSTVYLLISFLLYIGSFFANIPIIIYLQFENIPFYALITYYIVLFFVIYKLKKNISLFLLLKI